MPRMRILSAAEREAFDTPPLFNSFERKRFFQLPKGLMTLAAGPRTPTGRVGFVLMCGYFKATKRFFVPQDFHPRDIAAAARTLALSGADFLPERYSKQTRARHQQLILDFYGIASFDDKAKVTLGIEIAAMARQHLKPRLIFARCVDFLSQRRIQIPRSGRVLEQVRLGLHQHRAQLVTTMDTHLTDEARALLDSLFAKRDEHNHYYLTVLKKRPQSTKPASIRGSVADFEVLKTLHGQLECALSQLDLGVGGIRYYAGSVLRSRLLQLQQRGEADRYLYAAAFVAHQFFRVQDDLVDIWLNVMAAFHTSVAREHNEWLLENRKGQHAQLAAVVDELDTSVFGLIREIRDLVDTHGLSDAQKIASIRTLLGTKRTGEFEHLKVSLAVTGQDRSWYDVLQTRSVRLQHRLNPILRALTFEPNEHVASLLCAVNEFKASDGNIGERAPVDFLNAEERKVVHRDDGKLLPSLYKVLLFQHVTRAIKSGQLNLAQSYKYRPMDAYLIERERWDRDKAELLERAGLAQLAESQSALATLNHALERQYALTNDGAGDNQYLKLRVDGSFQIATPARQTTETEQLDRLLPQRHDVPLAQVLETINHHCAMLDAFEHWQQTHVQRTTSTRALLAAIIGLGCGIGIRKMARISSQVTESELENAVNWRFSLDNVRAANDAVVKAMDQMALPNLYRRDSEQLHTASDGQKFEVRTESLTASRSFKYFGQGQGIAAYTFVDERHFLWHSRVISASERESAYVIDGLMHNDVVKSDIHSTDTHGYTEAVFGLTHLLGFSFAPRIKGIAKQTRYIFKPKNRAEQDWAIGPHKTINEALIRENWDDLLRLATTVKLKENTASDLFRRLNSYSRQHALYQTLKAFGQIIKSLFILRYIDELELRQAIDAQLNKVELANRFTRAVAVGNPREFTQADEEEQQIAEACNRLIKNSIICWNYLYLARQIENAPDEQAKQNLRRVMAAHAPMSWAHINMLGEYDFSDETLKDTMGILSAKSAA